MKASVFFALFSGLLWAQVSPTAAERFFDRKVEPILRARCLPCHNQQLRDAGISFMDRDGLLKGGAHGPTIVPGKPDESMLIHAVRHEGEIKMPPGAKLSRRNIATLTEWIERGAAWGAKLRATDQPKDYNREPSIGDQLVDK